MARKGLLRFYYFNYYTYEHNTLRKSNFLGFWKKIEDFVQCNFSPLLTSTFVEQFSETCSLLRPTYFRGSVSTAL
jgi:hypothetical protein